MLKREELEELCQPLMKQFRELLEQVWSHTCMVSHNLWLRGRLVKVVGAQGRGRGARGAVGA